MLVQLSITHRIKGSQLFSPPFPMLCLSLFSFEVFADKCQKDKPINLIGVTVENFSYLLKNVRFSIVGAAEVEVASNWRLLWCWKSGSGEIGSTLNYLYIDNLASIIDLKIWRSPDCNPLKSQCWKLMKFHVFSSGFIFVRYLLNYYFQWFKFRHSKIFQFLTL